MQKKLQPMPGDKYWKRVRTPDVSPTASGHKAETGRIGDPYYTAKAEAVLRAVADFEIVKIMPLTPAHANQPGRAAATNTLASAQEPARGRLPDERTRVLSAVEGVVELTSAKWSSSGFAADTICGHARRLAGAVAAITLFLVGRLAGHVLAAAVVRQVLLVAAVRHAAAVLGAPCDSAACAPICVCASGGPASSARARLRSLTYSWTWSFLPRSSQMCTR